MGLDVHQYRGRERVLKMTILELFDVPARNIRTGGGEAGRMTTHRYMSPFMVDMDESSFDIWKNLYLVLQLLADVVCLPEWGIAVHHNVNFHEIILQSRVSWQDMAVS